MDGSQIKNNAIFQDWASSFKGEKVYFQERGVLDWLLRDEGEYMDCYRPSDYEYKKTHKLVVIPPNVLSEFMKARVEWSEQFRSKQMETLDIRQVFDAIVFYKENR